MLTIASPFHPRRYDNQLRPPHGPLIFEGEYAAISTNSSDLYAPVSEGVGRLEWSTMQSAPDFAPFLLHRTPKLTLGTSYHRRLFGGLLCHRV